MKIKKKLNLLKEQIIELAEEASQVKDLTATAEEYAANYGDNYTSFLKAVDSKTFIALSENYEAPSEDESEQKESQNIIIEFKVSKYEDGKITFDEPKYFGKKETFDETILKILLYKAQKNASFNKNDMVLRVETETPIDKLQKAKEEYLEMFGEKITTAKESLSEQTETYKEKARRLYVSSKEKTGNIIKRGLKNASDWADKNL